MDLLQYGKYNFLLRKGIVMAFCDLQMNQLNGFMAAAESRSFTSAAKKLYISHTALILQMNALEDELGFELFKRSRKGVILTEKGEMFYKGLKSIMKSGDKLITECQTKATMIRIGNMSDYHTFHLYRDFYAQFQKDHPEIRIRFVPTEKYTVLSLCEEGKIDIGFYYGVESGAQHPGLLFYPITIPNMGASVSLSDPLSKRKSLRMEDLEGRDLFVSNISTEELAYSQFSTIRLGSIHQFDLTEQNLYTILENGGVVLTPIFEESLSMDSRFIPFHPPVSFTYQVVCRKKHSAQIKQYVDAYLAYDTELWSKSVQSTPGYL